MLDQSELEDALARLPLVPAEGVAYRVIPARHYLTALSAIGSLQRGGRYNPRGKLEALYLSDNPVTALHEVEAIQQTSSHLVGRTFSPKTVLSVAYRIQHALDLTLAENLHSLESSITELIQPWVLEQSASAMAATQRLGWAASQAGVEMLRVPSAKDPTKCNLVIYPANLRPGSTLHVYDDSGFIDAQLP